MSQVENLREVEKRTVTKQEQPKAKKQHSYQEQKKLKSLNNKLSNIESKINQLEKEIKADDVALETNYEKTVSDKQFFEAYEAKKLKLKTLMQDWEDVEFQLEALS